MSLTNFKLDSLVFFFLFIYFTEFLQKPEKKITIMCNNSSSHSTSLFHNKRSTCMTNIHLGSTAQNTSFITRGDCMQQGLQRYHLRIYILLVRTTHNSMQVTTGHYEWHQWHNTCWNDFPRFLETRTHHHKKCSRYAYVIRKANKIRDKRRKQLHEKLVDSKIQLHMLIIHKVIRLSD